MDVFVWQPADMVGVPREIAEHRLNVYRSVEPIVQKKRSMGPEKTKAMNKQVTELLNAGILRPIRYQTWVANPVMVAKANGGWRMYVDYKDINKACPKDCYPLPEIDLKVDSLAPYRFKCFLDAYKGYHQIQMAKEDEDKTAFRADMGTFCYTKMPFGLKNAGATYQRLMDTAFVKQIGVNLEVYVDDLVIKSREEDQMLLDIQKTFDQLRTVRMKLNPSKCSFGMEEGKFLGVVVTKDGFRANPDKVQAIERMPSPSSVREVQTLMGRLVALNRFLSNYASKSFPFVNTLKSCLKKSNFAWTNEAEAAFKEMKECLSHLPTFTAPLPKEPLTLYLSVTERAIGAVLLVDRKTVQTPIYYISRTLLDAETRYSTMEKLVLALIHASRRLRRYFHGHPINVLTDNRISDVLRKPETSGCLAKWAIELGEHTINYKPRPAVKGQVLADFATEISTDKIAECLAEQDPAQPTPENERWNLYTDGASNSDGAGAGLRLISPNNKEYTYAIRLDFAATN